MAHIVEVNEVKEKIYFLIEMALAAEHLVSRYAIGVDDSVKTLSKHQYWKRTKSIVSNYSLEIAVKLRNTLELLQFNGFVLKLEPIIHVYSVGALAKGAVKKNDLRYICNKIIHAKSFSVDAVGSANKHKDLIWWSGDLTLSGTEQGKNGEEWSFFFNVVEWCDALLSFLYEVEDKLTNIQINSQNLFLLR
jgi:hypothetical protein